MRTTAASLALVAVLCSGGFAAQEPALTNDDVVGLVKAGLGAAVIKAKIAGSACRFDTSPRALQA